MGINEHCRPVGAVLISKARFASYVIAVCPHLFPAETSKRARATIADLGERFVRSGDTVLCHGHSRVVLSVLRRAAAAVSGRARGRAGELMGSGGFLLNEVLW